MGQQIRGDQIKDGTIGSADVDQTQIALKSDLVGMVPLPVGLVQMHAGSLTPSGWLRCDGASYSRTTYASLFAVVGTTFGSGDGSTTFNVPDLRLRFVVGVNGSNPLGTTGGSSQVTLTTDQLPSHSHTVTDPGHTHTLSNVVGPTYSSGTLELKNGYDYFSSLNNSSVVNSNSTGISIGNTGSGNPVTVMPPYMSLYYIIKT